ncbi:MAG: hypothetical protein DBX59_06385 [Bacillota bacterium]|nr:MAG: hypothetical protein DBX59_06385 [Bacillota bacterium]
MKKTAFYEYNHDKENNFVLMRNEEARGGTTLPHFHRCIEIIYVTGGKMRCEVDGESFYAEKDDIVFARRCAVHELYPAPVYDDYVLIVKSAYAGDFSALLDKETLPPLLDDKVFNRRVLTECFEKMHEADTSSYLVAKGYVDVLMGMLLSHYEKRPVVAAPNLSTVVSALNYIDNHFAEPLTLDSLARHFGYNKYYFSRLFNAYIGENLSNYINMVRVQKLVAAAENKDKVNFSDLAFDFGFDSMTTFYRHFNRIYEKTPKDVIGN